MASSWQPLFAQGDEFPKDITVRFWVLAELGTKSSSRTCELLPVSCCSQLDKQSIYTLTEEYL